MPNESTTPDFPGSGPRERSSREVIARYVAERLSISQAVAAERVDRLALHLAAADLAHLVPSPDRLVDLLAVGPAEQVRALLSDGGEDPTP